MRKTTIRNALEIERALFMETEKHGKLKSCCKRAINYYNEQEIKP